MKIDKLETKTIVLLGQLPSSSTDLLSPRLIRAVGARIYVRSSYSQWRSAVTWIRTQALAVASSAL